MASSLYFPLINLWNIFAPPADSPTTSFHPFPLLPEEIRLQIWTMTFPEGRRIGPWICEDIPWRDRLKRIYRQRTAIGCLPCSRAIPFEGPGYNEAKTDPVALWVNRESRREALRHYHVREPERLQCLQKYHGVTYPAHIDFAKDTFAFGDWYHNDCHDPIENLFLSKLEMEKVAHLQVYFWRWKVQRQVGDSIAALVKCWITCLPNLQDILVDITYDRIEGDEGWTTMNGTDMLATGLISAELKEARNAGKAVLEQMQTRSWEEGGSWKMPLLVIGSGLWRINRPLQEVIQLVDECRSSTKKGLVAE